jgi:long-chain fatty acid transport protein
MRQKLTAAAALLLIPSMSFGAGFALFEAGARSFAMGGAFAAVADDPSAMFWNPAGLAFQADKGMQFMGGATLIFPEQDFFGEDPFPGEGYVTSQKSQMFFPPHLYFVAPVNDRTVFGLSILATFGLGTHWEAEHLGRFISKRVELEAVDISPNIGFQLTEWLSFGLAIDYRITTIDLTRQIGVVDPFTQSVADVGQVHMFTDGAGNDAWAWHAGFLAKLGSGLSLGVSYRSDTDVDVEGEASFSQYSTGNPMLDALVASLIPFDENIPVSVKIEYPASWTVGLAWSNEKWTVSGQVAWFDWSIFQELNLVFPSHPEFNEGIDQRYVDTNKYGLGLEYRASPRWAFQLGLEYDETPQPEEVMSPLLGDGDREVITFGVSWTAKHLWIDTAFQYIDLETRSTPGYSSTGYEGRYEGGANLFAASIGYRF